MIDACLLVIDGSIRVCCNDFVTHTHTYTYSHTHAQHTRTHTHTHPTTETSILVCFNWPGAGVHGYHGVRGRINILKVLKASYWPGAGVRGDPVAPGDG